MKFIGDIQPQTSLFIFPVQLDNWLNKINNETILFKFQSVEADKGVV